MIVLPRNSLRQFRSVAKRCRAGRAADPAPPFTIAADPTAITLFVTFGEVALSLAIPATGNTGTLVVAALLDAVDGSDDDSVELHPESKRTVTVRWTDRDLPRERSFDLIRPEPRHDPPSVPESWTPVPVTVLAALHEAGRIAAREPGGRFAFHRVQIQRDRIVATDSRQVLIQAGFTLPAPAKAGLLVPAIPAFGSKEFRGHPVQLGVTATHLVLRIGLWTVWLACDSAGKYPDVDEVVPKCLKPTVVTVSDADAAYLADALPTLPGHADENCGVTLDLAGGRVVVRAKGDGDEIATEFLLAGSTATGPPVRYALDRQYLKRAIALGFRTLQFADAHRPFVANDGDRTYLAAGLQPDAALPPTSSRNPPTAAGLSPAVAVRPTRSSLENLPMKSLNGSGSPPSGRIEPAAPEDLDLHAEAESLRLALVDVVQKVARLVAALKHQRKEKKALTQVWSSLKSLNLGP